MRSLRVDEIEKISGGSTESDAFFGVAKCIMGAGLAFGGLIAAGPTMGLSGALAWGARHCYC